MYNDGGSVCYVGEGLDVVDLWLRRTEEQRCYLYKRESKAFRKIEYV